MHNPETLETFGYTDKRTKTMTHKNRAQNRNFKTGGETHVLENGNQMWIFRIGQLDHDDQRIICVAMKST